MQPFRLASSSGDVAHIAPATTLGRGKARHVKNIVLMDENNRPVGLLTARAVLRVLLGDAEDAQAQMVDYVSGVGYR